MTIVSEPDLKHLDVLIKRQKEIDANASNMARDIVDAALLESLEQAKNFAMAWITTAAQSARNEEYFRGRLESLVGLLEKCGDCWRRATKVCSKYVDSKDSYLCDVCWGKHEPAHASDTTKEDYADLPWAEHVRLYSAEAKRGAEG